ncbi:MAG: molybdopterin-guanine dinucleotide biosynthesis protein B, partial [Magnetococcales bacterium]|nr:molybdopterin-guanine dinucleotide biosynthesis protein B [Magnetococcales bacterium]
MPQTPVIGFAAPSGSGKTTLLEAVIRLLSGWGLRVAAVKHGHHPADPDIPGKDTFRFRQAGAQGVIFASPARWFLIQDLTPPPPPPPL